MDGLTPDPAALTTSDSDVEMPEMVENLFEGLITEAKTQRSEQLDKAITAIITAFGDLDLIARSWSVDPDEVAAELEIAGENADRIALQLLQTYNPK